MKSASLFRITLILVALLATACSGSSSSDGTGGVNGVGGAGGETGFGGAGGQPAELPEPDEPLDLTESAAPFDLGSIEAKYYEAISYGPHEENLFDIYLPESEAPTSLLVYIHGGGFTGGSRDTTNHEERVLALLAEGVAYASIDYRLLQSPDAEGVIKPLSDSTRALQFLRYHANQLNIDRDSVILMGGSAGAGTSLWIAFNDDMADRESEDPVAHHSTRVTAAIAIATQATYDIGKWSTVVFEEYMLDLLTLADALGLSQRLLDFYAITDIEDFESEEILEYRARVDMLELMDANDPPFYVRNDLEPAGPSAPPLSVNLAFHHANHALVLADQADEIGLENVAYIKGLMIEDPSGEDDVEFALRHFGL
jgi:pimeloyl-ACP methyl ester carboxylesterase